MRRWRFVDLKASQNADVFANTGWFPVDSRNAAASAWRGGKLDFFRPDLSKFSAANAFG